MSEERIKRRLNRAIKRAADILKCSNYTVIFLNDDVFSIEAFREREIRKIRVVVDEIKKEDEAKIKSYKFPEFCSKEIWCKKINQSNFEIKEIA